MSDERLVKQADSDWHLANHWERKFRATEAERDELRNSLEKVITAEKALFADICRLQDELDQTRGQLSSTCQEAGRYHYQVNLLRAALEKYGRHDEGCARAGLEFKLREEDYPCTCGFTEALTLPAPDVG